MGGKRGAQTSGNAQGKAAANRDVADGGASRKGQSRGLSVQCSDKLQRVLLLLVENVFVEPAVVFRCFQAFKPLRRELEARGFCHRIFRLCSTLVTEQEQFSFTGRLLVDERLGQNVQQRLHANCGQAEHAFFLDAYAFLQRSLGWRGDLAEWLQAASQEPDASFFSEAAASTAQVLGIPLVQWAGKPQGRYPVLSTLAGHSSGGLSVEFSPDGKRVVSSGKNLVKIWNAATGAEVRISLRSELRLVRCRGGGRGGCCAHAICRKWSEMRASRSVRVC